MTETDSKSLSVTLRRTFKAPIELVYSAWMEARHVEQWMKCDAKATLKVGNWVPRAGERFTTHMVLPGVFDTRGSGRFLEVDPPLLLVYAIDGDSGFDFDMPETTVRVEFRKLGAETEVTVTHSGVPSDDMCSIIEGGWTGSMAQLAEIVASLG